MAKKKTSKKISYQVVYPAEFEYVVKLSYNPRMDFLNIDFVDCRSEYIKLIVSAVSNLVRKNNCCLGKLVRYSDFGNLCRIQVKLGRKILTPRLTLICNGDIRHYARYTLHF